MSSLHDPDGHPKAGPTMWKCLKAHRKPLLVHTLILSAFLLFCFLLSDPLFARFETIAGESELHNMSLPAETDEIVYHLETVRGGAHIAEVRGWAYVEGEDVDDAQVHIVLRSRDRCYVFDTMRLPKDYDDLTIVSYRSGFVCNIPSSRITSGDYVIGIYIRNGDVEAFRCTDWVLEKSKSGLA